MKSVHYVPTFYNDVMATSDPSANIVVPLLMDLVRPQSVADIGCGSGAWLSHFKKHGCKIIGFDGPWVEDSQLLIPTENFHRVDLDAGILWNEEYDLAICLEVAEHLPEKTADLFVASLCRIAPVVCFSAAIPGQGGTNHLNEQWQSYWISKFKIHGFDCFDAVRPSIWDEEEVAVHYCQNCLIFAKTPFSNQEHNKLKEYEIRDRIPNLVHPRLLADKTSLSNNSFRKFFLGFLPLYLKSRIGIPQKAKSARI